MNLTCNDSIYYQGHASNIKFKEECMHCDVEALLCPMVMLPYQVTATTRPSVSVEVHIPPPQKKNKIKPSVPKHDIVGFRGVVLVFPSCSFLSIEGLWEGAM